MHANAALSLTQNRQSPAKVNNLMADHDHEDKLARFAALCVTAGLDLHEGQELIVSAPIEAQPFVGHVAAAAYRAGAPLVTCLYEDPALIRARFDHGTDESRTVSPVGCPTVWSRPMKAARRGFSSMALILTC